MAKVKNIDSKKQVDQTVPANPFMRIDLFPGFVPSQETIDDVNARLAKLRQPRKAENPSKIDVE